jgi:hypothetical protein
VPGFFEETLPTLADRRWALVRLDGDTYEATRVSLEVLYPGLAAGGHLVIDDYLQLDPCREAVDEFRREHGITEPIEPIDWSGARWRKRTEAAAGRVGGPAAARANGAAPQAVERKPLARVPAIEEVELRHELERMRERLGAAEAEIERLTADPMRRVFGGIKRRIRAKR